MTTGGPVNITTKGTEEGSKHFSSATTNSTYNMYFDNTGGVDLSFLRPSESLCEDEFWTDHSYLLEKDHVITISVLIVNCDGDLHSHDHIPFSFKPLDCSGDLDLLISMLCA